MEKAKKRLSIIITSVLILALVTVSIAALVMNGINSETPVVPGKINGGMTIDPHDDENFGVQFESTIIPKLQYAEYGVSPLAETAQQITATITPANAEYKTLDWSVAWESGASGKFGNGKTVTDYVTVTPTSDGALSATLTCSQAFGETIILTASLRGFPDIKGTRKIQYQQKLNGSTLNIAYTNATYSAANTTWNFVEPALSSGIYFSTSTLSFPKSASTFADFKNYYSSTGSKKGTYAVTITVKGTSIYTKPMDVGEVKLYSVIHPKSKYPVILSGANGAMPSKFNDSSVGSSQAFVLATGTGATANLTGFDFVNFFCLENSPSLNWGVYKQSFAQSTNSKNVFMLYLDAVVNGETVECGRYAVNIDAASLGTFAANINIGSADIVY